MLSSHFNHIIRDTITIKRTNWCQLTQNLIVRNRGINKKQPQTKQKCKQHKLKKQTTISFLYKKKKANLKGVEGHNKSYPPKLQEPKATI